MVAAFMVDTSQGKDDIMFLRFVGIGIGVFEICDDAGFMMRSGARVRGRVSTKNERLGSVRLYLRVPPPHAACLRDHHAVTLAHQPIIPK